MNCSTTRCTTPAAAPRTGRGESALPRPDQGTKTQLPFAALPHDLRKDPRLKGNQTAIVLAATLLEYAMTKAYCYPTNATLAADMGCCVSTIRNALAALRAAGWIRIELGPRQPNGRRIWLTWRTGNRVAGNQVTGQAPAQPSLVPEYQHREHLGARNQVASGAGLPQVSDTRQPVAPRVQPADSPVQPAGPQVQPSGRGVKPSGPEEEWFGEREKNRNVNVTDSSTQPTTQTPVPLTAQAAIPQDAQADMPPAAKATAPPTAQGGNATLVAQTPKAPVDKGASGTLVAQPPRATVPQAAKAATPLVAQASIPMSAHECSRPGASTSARADVGLTNPLIDDLKALGPDTAPDQVRRIAARLAAALHDEASLGGYIVTLSKVVAGTVSKACLLAAYKAGLGAVNKARKPGAIFQWTLANWAPPPKPSEIRYYQQRTVPTVTGTGPVQCMASAGPSAGETGASLAEPAPTAENLETLRSMAADQRHPLRHVAQRRLEEIAADQGHPLRDVARRLVEGLGSK